MKRNLPFFIPVCASWAERLNQRASADKVKEEAGMTCVNDNYFTGGTEV